MIVKETKLYLSIFIHNFVHIQNWYLGVSFNGLKFVLNHVKCLSSCFLCLTSQASAHRMGRPTNTAFAPRARAFSTSVPVRTPPSRKTSTFPSTASTISGKTSICTHIHNTHNTHHIMSMCTNHSTTFIHRRVVFYVWCFFKLMWIL